MYTPNFPIGYQNPYQQFYQQPQQIQPQPQQPQQIVSGGFVSVSSEDVVTNYPVAPGNCVTFKIEGQPIVLEKSMGFSQLESPRIEKYQLVKVESAPDLSVSQRDKEITDYALKSDLNPILDTLRGIEDRISVLENPKIESEAE